MNKLLDYILWIKYEINLKLSKTILTVYLKETCHKTHNA